MQCGHFVTEGHCCIRCPHCRMPKSQYQYFPSRTSCFQPCDICFYIEACPSASGLVSVKASLTQQPLRSPVGSSDSSVRRFGLSVGWSPDRHTRRTWLKTACCIQVRLSLQSFNMSEDALWCHHWWWCCSVSTAGVCTVIMMWLMLH